MLAFLLSLSAWVKVGASAGIFGFIWKYVVKPLRSIGDNGKETLFELLHHMSDQQAIQGSLQDILDLPIFLTDVDGHVVSANVACFRLLGWSVEDLKHGGWRSKLDREAQLLWDESIKQRAIFERSLHIADNNGHRLRVRVLAKPIMNGKQHLGWRGMIDRFGDGEDDG